MKNHTFFILQAVLAAVLLSIHFVAFQYDLYWHYLWLDVPMHFVGGLWAALAGTWFFRLFGRASFLHVLFGVIAIGLAWEVMEYVVGFQREANYAFDTSLDLVMDLLGGIVGFFAARGMVQSHAMPAHEPNVASSDVGT